tara:strand:+ start:757 stop:1458 length:702 start_codon:yes stop_codon:yes gene_type:complete
MTNFTIVIPVYNEGKNLKKLISQIYRILPKKSFELIIVDDSSNDETPEIMSKIRKNNLRYIIRKEKRDLSKSCIMGFEKAKYKNILVMDGDLQHKPGDILKFLNIKKKIDPHIIVGSRNLFDKKKYNLSFQRLFASRILILIVNLLLGKKTSDPMSGFFMFKKSVFTKSKKILIKKGYKILLDLIYSGNKSILVTDIDINFDSRKKGNSKMNYKILFFLISMILEKFLYRIFK